MDGWLAGWLDGWMDGWMDGWIPIGSHWAFLMSPSQEHTIQQVGRRFGTQKNDRFGTQECDRFGTRVIASRLEAIATTMEAIASRLEATVTTIARYSSTFSLFLSIYKKTGVVYEYFFLYTLPPHPTPSFIFKPSPSVSVCVCVSSKVTQTTWCVVFQSDLSEIGFCHPSMFLGCFVFQIDTSFVIQSELKLVFQSDFPTPSNTSAGQRRLPRTSTTRGRGILVVSPCFPPKGSALESAGPATWVIPWQCMVLSLKRPYGIYRS